MKAICLAGAMVMCGAGAQEPSEPVLTQGVSVRMAVAQHAIEVREADEPNALVLAITAEGKLFAGVTATEPAALSALAAGTVYLKADSRAPFQQVLAVLDALRGKSVVLLAAPPANAAKGRIVPPYGIRLTMSK